MASDEELSRRMTNPEMPRIAGNLFFVQAAGALGLDPEIARQVLSDVVLAHGVKPSALTREQLRELLPEVEQRLHLIVNDELTGAIMTALGRFVGAPR